MSAARRQYDLLLWGVHYLRTEPCESCGARLARQEQAGPPAGRVPRWVEIVDDDGTGRPQAYIVRDHDGDRCRSLRASSR